VNTEFFDGLKYYPDIWEIFVNKKDDQDTESKFTGSDSSLIMTPAVSEFLIEQGYQVSYPDNKNFAICLTHDVDDIYPTFYHRLLSVLWSIKKYDWNTMKEQLFRSKKKPGVYVNFREIIELEKKYGAKSTFYFLTADKDPKRFRYNINDITDELKYIIESGCKVGLHGGYYSYNDIDAVKREKNLLEEALGNEVIGYRNHYLRFQQPQTWEILEKCGFRYDTTYGYTNMIGFRNGMCHPFRPYDINNQHWLNIYEFPLHIMECSMYGRHTETAWGLITQLLMKAELNKGVLTVLWHNNVFDCPYRENWAVLYEKILQYGKTRGAWMTSGKEIWKWWMENGY
jgi:peptidoglycan/xylan/chitin deacetylase (PgdA/CDA1 family)